MAARIRSQVIDPELGLGLHEKQYKEYLIKLFPLLKYVSYDKMKQFIRCSKVEKVRENTIITTEDKVPSHLYVVIDGQLNIYRLIKPAPAKSLTEHGDQH